MDNRVLLIIGGDPAGHPFHRTAPLTCGILLSSGFDEVHMESHLDRVKRADGLAGYNVVVLHGRFPEREEPDEPAERGFENFVHSGGGLVIIHIASSSFAYLKDGTGKSVSPSWLRLAGRVWEYGTSGHPEPAGPFRVNVVDTTHPITADIEDFDLVEDERYQDLRVDPDAKPHDLATATLDGRTEPVAWVVTPPAGGRVFHIALGHNHTTYENKAFRMLLNRGVAWAAGLLV